MHPRRRRRRRERSTPTPRTTEEEALSGWGASACAAFSPTRWPGSAPSSTSCSRWTSSGSRKRSGPPSASPGPPTSAPDSCAIASRIRRARIRCRSRRARCFALFAADGRRRARARNPNLRSRGPFPARAARTDRSAALAVGIRGKQVLQGQLRAGLVARSARPFRNHHELVGAVGTPGRVAKQHVGRHQFRRLHREHGHRPGNRGEAGQHQVRVRGPSRNHAFSLLRRRGARADAPRFAESDT